MAFDPQLLAFLLNQRERRQQDEQAALAAEDRRTREALNVGMGIAMQPDADIGAWLPLLRSQGLRAEHESALLDAQKAERGVRKRKEQEAQTIAQGQAAGGALTDPLVAPELSLEQVLPMLRSVEASGALGGANLGDLDVAQIRSQAQAREKRKNAFAAELDKARELRNQTFGDENSLRTEFINQSKVFVTTRDAYDRVQASLNDPSAGGDLSLIFAYMKLLDPTSSVREGEQASAANAAGVPGWIVARYNAMLGNTEGKLPPKLREDFGRRSNMLFKKALDGQKALEREYSGLAKRNDLSPRNVIVDYRARGGQSAPQAPPGMKFSHYDDQSGNPIFLGEDGKFYEDEPDAP